MPPAPRARVLALGAALVAALSLVVATVAPAPARAADPDGAPCSSAATCTSGFCVDGVCCNDACVGKCRSCVGAKTGSSDGSCGSMLIDTDPDDECAPEGSGPCFNSGLCGGSRACWPYVAQDTPCGPPTCRNGRAEQDRCGVRGSCNAQMPVDCAPYACNAAGVACRTSCARDGDCAPDAYCDVDGACQDKVELGGACAEDRCCLSGICAEGLCCDRRCDGQCEECSALSNRGVCVPVFGAPRGKPACAAVDDPSCAGTCDGLERTRCTFPRDNRCGAPACSDDGASPRNACDGAGRCTASSSPLCAPYACLPATGICAERCSGDVQCAPGASCDLTRGECVTALPIPEGGVDDGGVFDAAAVPDGATAPDAGTAAPEQLRQAEGCSCRAAPSPGRGAWWGALAWGVLRVARRRRGSGGTMRCV